jgi:hypothetical protein
MPNQKTRHTQPPPESFGSPKFGLRSAAPTDAVAVWGARWIWPDDEVWDRQDIVGRSDHDRHVLFEWLTPPDGVALRAARAEARRMAGAWDLGAREDRQVTLYEDDQGIIVGNPQSSGGYLYVSAWLKPARSEKEMPAPTGERRDPREIAYEWELASDGEFVVLTITHKRASLDIETGRELPGRFEAEVNNQRQRPSTSTAAVREIPFSGLRICWEETPRFSKKGMEAFADTALARLAGLYLTGDARVASYFPA